MSHIKVGIIYAPSMSPGGIQTLVFELVKGLNQVGIRPDLLWDWQQDWSRITGTEEQIEVGFRRAAVPFPPFVRSMMPSWLRARSYQINGQYADYRIREYDFIYNFQNGIRMPPGIPNVCWINGPYCIPWPPTGAINKSRIQKAREWLSRKTSFHFKADMNSVYVTHTEWIANAFQEQHGIKPIVIWPPARSRPLSLEGNSRKGFLFFSRIAPCKRPDILIDLAEMLPNDCFTIAGAVNPEDQSFMNMLWERKTKKKLDNLLILENPSEPLVIDLLQCHKYFIFSSVWEPFGIVTVEAIQAGLIPFVHDSGGQVEIVPFNQLRFTNQEDLIQKIHLFRESSIQEQQELLSLLQNHIARGSSQNYRREMLNLMNTLMK